MPGERSTTEEKLPTKSNNSSDSNMAIDLEDPDEDANEISTHNHPPSLDRTISTPSLSLPSQSDFTMSPQGSVSQMGEINRQLKGTYNNLIFKNIFHNRGMVVGIRAKK